MLHMFASFLLWMFRLVAILGWVLHALLFYSLLAWLDFTLCVCVTMIVGVPWPFLYIEAMKGHFVWLLSGRSWPCCSYMIMLSRWIFVLPCILASCMASLTCWNGCKGALHVVHFSIRKTSDFLSCWGVVIWAAYVPQQLPCRTPRFSFCGSTM